MKYPLQVQDLYSSISLHQYFDSMATIIRGHLLAIQHGDHLPVMFAVRPRLNSATHLLTVAYDGTLSP